MKKLLFLILLIATPVWASPPTRLYDFVPGTTIRSDEIDAELNEIVGYLNVGIDSIRTNGIDAISEIHTLLRSGEDNELITGTAGTANQLGIWNSDGDLVGTGVGFVMTGANVTISGKLDVDDLKTGANAGTDLCVDSDNTLCLCNYCK